MASLLEEVQCIVARQLDAEASAVVPGARLIQDLHADSLDVMELLMDLEQTYGIEITDEDMRRLATVADVAAYIQKRKANYG